MRRYSILILSFILAACSGDSTPTDTNTVPPAGGENTSMAPEQTGDGSAGVPNDEGENSESGDSTTDTGGDDVENASVSVTGDGQVETISNDQKTDIVITGSNHTINIESDVGVLSIAGANSLLRFSANVSVDTCNVVGSDNSAERAENVTLNCTVQGSGNSGFEGDGSAGVPNDEGEDVESAGSTTDTGGDDAENALVTVSGDGQVETISNDQKTDIVITGANHTVDIESDIGVLSVTGANSLLRFSANVNVDTCNVVGSDNSAEREENVTLNCTVLGSGNSGFE